MLILTVCFRLPEVLKVVISHMFSFKQFYYNRCYFYLQGGLTCNLRFYSITQRSSSAPGLLWEMPGSNPELTSIVHCTIQYNTVPYSIIFLFLRSGAISMGLLTVGTPLEWSEMVKWQDHVRKFGVKQFIRTYNRLKVQRYNTE